MSRAHISAQTRAVVSVALPQVTADKSKQATAPGFEILLYSLFTTRPLTRRSLIRLLNNAWAKQLSLHRKAI